MAMKLRRIKKFQDNAVVAYRNIVAAIDST